MTRLLALLMLCLAAPAFAVGDYTLVLKDHEFVPRVIKVPANVPFALAIRNEDTTPAAIDSTSLGEERQIIEGKAVLVLKLKLKPGNYDIYDPFHSGTEGIIAAE